MWNARVFPHSFQSALIPGLFPSLWLCTASELVPFGTLMDLHSLEQAQGQGVGIVLHNQSIPMEMGCSLHPALALPVSLTSREHSGHRICLPKLPGKQMCHLIPHPSFPCLSPHPHYKKHPEKPQSWEGKGESSQ